MSLKDELEEQSQPPENQRAWAEVTPDGGEISTGVLPTPITTDWTAILVGFGLDPTVFEVVDDTVRMSKWQTSKRLENGDRDVAWLYSYRARFRRKNLRVLPDEDIEALRKRVGTWKQPKRAISKPSDEPPSTFIVNWADLQLGKSAGGGVEATVERVLESLEKTVQQLHDLRRKGRNIESAALVNMGDPFEGLPNEKGSASKPFLCACLDATCL